MDRRYGAVAAAVGALLVTTACLPPEWGANAILHPFRRRPTGPPDISYEDVLFRSEGVALRGWRFPPAAPRRGLIVYLHGSADNRQSGVGFAHRFVPRGFEVLAYDSRAHGDSGGDSCTYGFHEKKDLSHVLDSLHADSAVLLGISLGAAVALQAAAEDPRIVGVIAVSPFSDLESVVRQRAPFFASKRDVDGALALAEARGQFRVAAVSPREAARRIHVPVLLIHGADDHETGPEHSRAIFDALAGPKELLLVPGAGHADTLARADSWAAIDDWLSRVAPAR
jgi:pimeloyl-ACP methyl ester carboxylesterase